MPTPTHGIRLVAVLVLAPVLAALALWAFAWPAARTAPRDLPVGVAGPDAAAEQVTRGFDRREGAFAVHRYPDEAAARDAVESREVYGAVVAGPDPKLLTASAGGPVVAQLLQQAVTEQAAARGARVRTVDVVPAPEKDPRGAGLSASVLPLALAGIAVGSVVTLLELRGPRALAALAGSSALVGVAGAGLAHTWLGLLTGDWWAEAGVLALSSLAVSGAVAGLGALFGIVGVGTVGAAVMLFGNPFAGASSAPEMLPEPAGALGQWLPPGAGTTLLRSVSYFDGAAVSEPMMTLAGWAVLGLALVLLGGRLAARPGKDATARALAPAGGFPRQARKRRSGGATARCRNATLRGVHR